MSDTTYTYPTFCAVCALECWHTEEARTLSIRNGDLVVAQRGSASFAAADQERAMACGQTHALVLAERYIERGTFAPAPLQTDDPLEAIERNAYEGQV